MPGENNNIGSFESFDNEFNIGAFDPDNDGYCNICNQNHPGADTCPDAPTGPGTDGEPINPMVAEARLDLIQTFNSEQRLNYKIDFFLKGIPYVFMTCPVLNLCETNVLGDSFLTYLATSTEDNKEVLRHLTNRQFTDTLYNTLTSGGTGCNDRLIPLVTNLALSIDIKDTVARTKEVGETFYGYKQVHPGSLVDSIVGDEISIKYLEMADLPILKMHKAWQDYIEKVRRGTFIPSEQAINDGFIDYVASIYYILCDFDGETVKYWAKYTGVAPLNVPYSSLGGDFSSHEIPDITINYSYCYKEDMTISALMDFNRVCKGLPDITNLQWGINNVEGNGYTATATEGIINGTVVGNYPTIIKVDKSQNGNNTSVTDTGYYFKLKMPVPASDLPLEEA